MDYGELLYKAQEINRNASNKEVRCYKTTFAPPKKLERSKVSSDNIKKFLARKEQEERQRKEEAQRKKEELLALRSQDKKAQRRVQVMLKSTKSANKSVMEDAIDNVNTADTLNGFKQCDEDDYGYVSQEASAFYTKLLNKYENMPPEAPKFQPAPKKEVKDLNAAKDRVRAALQREAEEELLPHKRKRKKHEEGDDENDTKKDSECRNSHTDKKGDNSNDSKDMKDSNSNKPKKKSIAPPPMNFDQLLQIAQKKQFEPIVINEALLKKEPERLMTKKQKLEFEREQECRLNKGKRHLNKSDENSKESSTVGQSDSKKKKIESSKTEKLNDKSVSRSDKSENSSNKIAKPENSSNKTAKPENSSSKSEKSVHFATSKTEHSSSTKIDKKTSNGPILNGSNKPVDNKAVMDRLKKDSSVWSKSLNNNNSESPSKPPKTINSSGKTSNVPSKNTPKIEKKSILEAKLSKNEPPNLDKKKMSLLELQIQQMREEHKQLMEKLKKQEVEMQKISSRKSEPPPSKKIIKKPILEKRKPPPVAKRRIDSESEEYDSELDDFIDDGPEDGNDYSKYISEIFGYDKSKYRNVEEEDDECMESNFAQISKEEFVSAKIGLLEDLEDIRKEQEEKKRLKEKKMKKLVEERKKRK